MRSKPNDITRLLIKISGNNKPEIIAFDVEDDPIICDYACIPVHCFYFIEVIKLNLCKFINPTYQCSFSIRIFMSVVMK